MRGLDDIVPADECEDEVEFRAEDAVKVRAALGRLKPDQCEVLVLRFIEGMSYEDIARVVGCPLGTVRSRIYYAKAALRRIIERTAGNE